MAQCVAGFHKTLPVRDNVYIPRSQETFTKAFLHCITSLVLGRSEMLNRAKHHMNKAYYLFLRGKAGVLKSSVQVSLERYQVALPQDILLMIIRGLLQDATNDHSDIFTSYWDYLRQLVRLLRV